MAQACNLLGSILKEKEKRMKKERETYFIIWEKQAMTTAEDFQSSFMNDRDTLDTKKSICLSLKPIESHAISISKLNNCVEFAKG